LFLFSNSFYTWFRLLIAHLLSFCFRFFASHNGATVGDGGRLGLLRRLPSADGAREWLTVANDVVISVKEVVIAVKEDVTPASDVKEPLFAVGRTGAPLFSKIEMTFSSRFQFRWPWFRIR